jgi:hypothetical protein
MTHDATIFIAPILDGERWKKPQWMRPGRKLYWPSSLTLLPTKEPRPLLVNHDEGRQIGVVRKLWRMDWPGGAWIAADCTVTEPPRWLGRGTPASFGHYNVHVSDPGESPEMVTSAFVSEVSVLIGDEPAEPLARVLSLRPTEEPKPTRSPAAVPTSNRAADEIDDDYRPSYFDELERLVGYKVTWDNVQAALVEANRTPIEKYYDEYVAAKRQLEPGLIVRPGIGQVLGVR